MIIAPLTVNEADRLTYLDRLDLIRSERSTDFDAIVDLAADIFECPIALVSIVGEDEQWFKAKHGLGADCTSRDASFCAHAILQDEVFVVPDALKDERFHDNPLVTGDPHIRFYAGCPISADGVHILGSLCVIDRVPRQFDDRQAQQLQKLALAVNGLLRSFDMAQAAKRAELTQRAQNQVTQRNATLLDRITRVSGVGGWELSLTRNELFWTDQTKRIHDVDMDFVPDLDSALSFYEPDSRDLISAVVDEAIETRSGWSTEAELRTAKGKKLWVHTMGTPVVEDGEVVGLIGTIRDITQTKQDELALKESEALAQKTLLELRTILDRMNQGVSVFNSDARLTTWNQNYIEIFGKPEGEVQEGITLQELLEAEAKRGDFDLDVDQHLEDLYVQLALGEPVHSEFTLGSGRIISTVHSPMPDGGWVGTHTDITRRAQAEAEIRHASLHDALTGLPNRLKLEEDFQDWVLQSQQDGQEIAMVMLDLNKFKEVNDTHGHHIGDKLLKQVADRLRASVRSGDLVARIGGDEFVILLKCPTEAAPTVLDRLATVVVDTLARPFDVDGLVLQIGCSVGISLSGDEAKDYEAQMRASDAAMYSVKRTGESGYGFFPTQ
ncbi:diguanylate cyclase [Tropicibacter sp. R15_0]|uniref:sensor domain-containing diguanylate cyclase n=1 Tax=Tropicibacter sp. R15_0 TaxID=2821101 RepID=UPI001ADBD7A3|nr:diguanylate cyclase [Tropicibacter sp. R15_0]